MCVRASMYRTNLEAQKYRTLNQFKEDILRMFSNCEKYNGKSSEYGKESERLRVLFLNKINELE